MSIDIEKRTPAEAAHVEKLVEIAKRATDAMSHSNHLRELISIGAPGDWSFTRSDEDNANGIRYGLSRWLESEREMHGE